MQASNSDHQRSNINHQPSDFDFSCSRCVGANSHSPVRSPCDASNIKHQRSNIDDEPGPYVGLGVAALQTGKPEEAEIAFRVAYRLDPKCAQACAGLAMVAQRQGDLPRAFDFYMKSLELDPNNLMVLLGLFQVSCEMGSFARVTHYLEVYLRAHPGDTSVMFALGTLYLKDGRLRPARAILLELLALEPTHRDAANLLEEVEHTLGNL
jgi:cytochrome c-type biogenesis protein CcmH/NrfG